MTHAALGREVAALKPSSEGLRWTVALEGGGAAPPFIEVTDNALHRFWVISDETEDGSWQVDYYPTEAARDAWTPSWSEGVGSAKADPALVAGAIWIMVQRDLPPAYREAHQLAPDLQRDDRVKRQDSEE